MIIRNLEHLENTANLKKIEGGIAVLDFQFNSLALGTFNSISLSNVQTLAVSSPGVNISGTTGYFSLLAE